MDAQKPSGGASASGSAANTSKVDPARKHGIQDPSNRNNITCNYCGKVTTGGVYRFKQHLVGGFSNVVKCQRCPEHVREEIRTFMLNKSISKSNRQIRNYMDDIDEDGEEEVASPTLKRSKGIETKFASVIKGPMDVFLTPNAQDAVKARKDGKQQTINEVCRKELRNKACRDIARWFYDAGIPFNAVNYESFDIMIQSIGQFGRGLKGPSMYELRVPLLKQEVNDTLSLIDEHKKEWYQKGCSIMSDGWRDSIVQKEIVNFIVNSPKGSVFMRSIDVSDVVKDSTLLFKLLDSMVEEVGEENVVQVVTDNAANYVKAGKLLEAERPHLYWTPCAAHCLDLMLEDFGTQIPKVKDAIKKAIGICGYIYNHTGLLNMMRKFTNGRNLHRPAVTRFATSFITLTQIHKQQNNLRKMVTSEEWNKSKWAKEEGGKKIKSFILQPNFWRNILYSLKLAGPLVKVLRMVDGEKKPAMGYIYEAMDRAKETIADSFKKKQENYKKAFEIIDKRWECQLHKPLHAAGHYLNPEIFYENPSIVTCSEVMNGLISCIQRLVPDLETQDKIGEELSLYQDATGLFGMPMAVRQRKTKSPAEWWMIYGADAPNLRNFAVRVLSLTCSATGCERNWSVFQHLHTKKRNRLSQDRLKDMVFVKANRQLTRRFQSNNPILLSDIDESNEWLLGKMEDDEDDDDLVFHDDNLTWSVVSKASGAEEPSYMTRTVARAKNDVPIAPRNNKGKGIATTSKQTRLLSLIDEEEEEDIGGAESDEDDDDIDLSAFDDDDEEDLDLDDF